ncbi:hypothetical protein MHK_007696 [Candidatus Magnetomorum sp. HK-1]|nr:hypothetical protein MHK_007696 [Candidatus Magnetomorum sp. HK-1]
MNHESEFVMNKNQLEPQKKLKIFEKYDFSKAKLIEKAGIDEESPKTKLFHGITNVVQTIFMKIGIISDNVAENTKMQKNFENSVYQYYGWLQAKYQEINWDELEPHDLDLAIFYKMKGLIDDLGRAINQFLVKSRVEPEVSTDWIEYQTIEKKIMDIGKMTQQFRVVKERLKKQVAGC